MAKIIFLLYDVDGTLYTSRALRDAPKSMEEMPLWLVKYHQNLLHIQHQHIQKQGYKKVVIGLATNRQSYHFDASTSLTCLPLLPMLQNEFQTRLGENVTVVFDSFLMADTIKHQDGTSYLRACLDKYNHQPSLTHEHWWFDKTKVSLLYTLCHRAALHHPDDMITINLYDDLPDILESLSRFYSNNSDLLPRNITLNLYHYTGNTPFAHRASIQGTGEIDANYASTTLCMGYFWCINQRKSLQKYNRQQFRETINTRKHFVIDMGDLFAHNPGFLYKLRKYIAKLRHPASSISQQHTPSYYTAVTFAEKVPAFSVLTHPTPQPPTQVIADCLQYIASLPVWETISCHGCCIWNSCVPSGIKQIAQSPSNLSAIDAVAQAKLNTRRFWRKPITLEFYQLIGNVTQSPQQPGQQKQLIAAFCQKYKIEDAYIKHMLSLITSNVAHAETQATETQDHVFGAPLRRVRAYNNVSILDVPTNEPAATNSPMNSAPIVNFSP